MNRKNSQKSCYLNLQTHLVNAFLVALSTYSCSDAPHPNPLPRTFAKDLQSEANELGDSQGGCGTQAGTPSATLKLAGDTDPADAGKVINSKPRAPQNPSQSQPSGSGPGGGGVGGSSDPANRGNGGNPVSGDPAKDSGQAVDNGGPSASGADLVARVFGQDHCGGTDRSEVGKSVPAN